MSDAINVGREGVSKMVVTSRDTAIALSSGDVPVLATPRLIALLEEATCEALSGALESQLTTVGTYVEVAHRRATPIGARVTAHARVASFDGVRIDFDVHADHQTADGDVVEAIGRGRITRVIVDRDGFVG